MHKVQCGKCLGRGFMGWCRHVKGGVCFSCGGHGFKMYKNKPRQKIKYAFGTTDCFPQYWRNFPNHQKATEYASREEKSIFMTEEEYNNRFTDISEASDWAASQ